MCVIIIKPVDSTFTEESLKTCYENNPDGMGYMYNDGSGRIVSDKFLPKDFDEVKQTWDMLAGVDAIIHFRYRTAGSIVEGQCHPFRILKKKGNRPDMFFMHNGTFSIDTNDGENDTIAFKNRILKPILEHNPNILESEKFIKMLEGMDTWSRMCFLTGDGNIYVTRKSQWVAHEGCQLSNNYSVNKGHRDIKPVKGEWKYGRKWNNLTRMWEDPVKPIVKHSKVVSHISLKRPTEEDYASIALSVLQSFTDEEAIAWLESDRDDAVRILMDRQYFDQYDLGDLVAKYGLGYAMLPSEVDVESVIDLYPEAVVSFIKGERPLMTNHTF